MFATRPAVSTIVPSGAARENGGGSQDLAALAGREGASWRYDSNNAWPIASSSSAAAATMMTKEKVAAAVSVAAESVLPASGTVNSGVAPSGQLGGRCYPGEDNTAVSDVNNVGEEGGSGMVAASEMGLSKLEESDSELLFWNEDPFGMLDFDVIDVFVLGV